MRFYRMDFPTEKGLKSRIIIVGSVFARKNTGQVKVRVL